jgi:predicted nucleic acid-binding protein
MRVYVDTNVFGYAVTPPHPRFAVPTQDFFLRVQYGDVLLTVSDIVEGEILPAPMEVQDFYVAMQNFVVSFLTTNSDVRQLARAYVAAGVVPATKRADALHVAHATLASSDALVSWDGQHIIRQSRIHGYNQVNAQHGLPPLSIYRLDRFLQQFP